MNQYGAKAVDQLKDVMSAADEFRQAAETGMVADTDEGQREAAMSMIMTASNFLECGVLGIGYGLLAIAAAVHEDSEAG